MTLGVLGSPSWLFEPILASRTALFFQLAWRERQKSSTIVLRLRTVYMCLQPVASCLRSPPADTQLRTLSPVAFPPAAPTGDFVRARWKFECPLSLPDLFVDWFAIYLVPGCWVWAL